MSPSARELLSASARPHPNLRLMSGRGRGEFLGLPGWAWAYGRIFPVAHGATHPPQLVHQHRAQSAPPENSFRTDNEHRIDLGVCSRSRRIP